eukprot:gene8906-9858_t
MAHFMPPAIQDNPEGWGPCAVPDQFKDIPYQPFSKGDRIGKVSDWTGSAYQDRKYSNKYASQFGAGNQYAYYHEGDETSFQLVDTSKPHKTAYQRNKQRFNNARMKREREKQQRKEAIMMGQAQPKGKMRGKIQRNWGRGRYNERQNTQKNRNASVAVREEWKVLEDMDFPRLAKLKLPDISEPTNVYCAGTLEYYDKLNDRITTRNEKPLEGNNRIFHKVTTTDDPIIRKLTSKGNVFATDAIISTLMTCTRSVHSWDVVVQRVGNKLFFDKRDDSEFDLLTVYETAWDPPPEEGINSASNLALEATFINQNFSQQCLKTGEKFSFENKNPFVENDNEPVASVGYRYRKFDLGDNINLIVRCEHDAVLQGPAGENLFINIKTVNEWDSKVSGIAWRAKLDSQGGSVLATELKNNSCKLAKWTCSAILAGSEYLKLGYVSRITAIDSSKHAILGTQQFKPKEFADQIALNMDNGWGILRVIIDTCLKLPEGKYLILKDPNKFGALLILAHTVLMHFNMHWNQLLSQLLPNY